MKLLRGAQSFSLLEPGVVATIGNFDGVHLGHQNLIKALKQKAKSMNLPVLVILFEPQPREYFQQEKAPARLSSFREKLDKLKNCGVDYVYCIHFNKHLAQTSASDFIKNYLFNKLKINILLVGEDFRFGKNREGDINLLRTMSATFSCEVVTYSDFCIRNARVSSTQIRRHLHDGELNQAAQLLGQPYSMCGRITHGAGRGRQWGIPTANLRVQRLTLPLTGVFVVQMQWGTTKVNGVANIGLRPTVDGTKNVLEVHLFDFSESIYGTLVQVFFLHKLRDEVKFTNVDALITQIHQDIAAAKNFLKTPLKFNDFAE